MRPPTLTIAVAVAALLALTGCSGDGSARNPGSAAADTTTSTAPLPPPTPWAPSPQETQPQLKQRAALAVQTIDTYDLGDGTPEAAASRLTSAGLAPTLGSSAGSLLDPNRASSARVIYPQLGGLTATAASVMVVTEIHAQDVDGRRSRSTRVVDVRLTRGAGQWEVAAIASDGQGPAPTDTPIAGALTLLEERRVQLPGSAVADLRSGHIDPRVVDLLVRLAAKWRLSVSVLSTGHPPNVFGTNRTSNHTAGRGVDIWAVDDIPVIDQQRSSGLTALVNEALALGATEIGAPFDTDGLGGRMFTNEVHLDHLHLAFRGP